MLRKRTIASIAVCMIGVGVGLSVVGLSLGAHTGVTLTSRGWELSPKASEVSYVSGDRQIVEHEKLPAFSQMDLDIGVANVNIVSGEDYSISIDIDKNIPIKYQVKGDRLYVTQQSKNRIGGVSMRSGKVTITLPKEATLENNRICTGVGNWLISGFDLGRLTVESGVGNLEIADAVADRLEVEGGVGNITIDNVTSDEMRFTGGMGDFKGRNLVTQKMSAEGGVGNIEIQGTLKGDIVVAGGMGNIEVTTTEPLSAYALDVSKGLGSVRINNKKIGGVDDYRSNSSGEYLLKVECGVGNVTINAGVN